MVTQQLRPYHTVAVSPDGSRLAVSTAGLSDDLWSYDPGRDSWTRLTSEKDATRPVWSPDGERIAFGWNKAGAYNVYSIPPDGSGPPVQLTDGLHWSFPLTWSPEGETLVFQRQDPSTSEDLWTLSVTEGLSTRPLLATRFYEGSAALSPDGHWLAYASNESGRLEIYVQSFPDLTDKVAISSGGGSNPRWSHDGRELFYRSPGRMMRIQVNLEGGFRAGATETLFDTDLDSGRLLGTYDVTADGLRFLMIREPEQDREASQIVVVPNFALELKEKVPDGN